MICGNCEEEVKFLTQVRTKERAVCPKCGQRDTVDEAVRIANDSLIDRLMEGVDKLEPKSGDDGAGRRAAKNKRTHKWRFIEV